MCLKKIYGCIGFGTPLFLEMVATHQPKKPEHSRR